MCPFVSTLEVSAGFVFHQIWAGNPWSSSHRDVQDEFQTPFRPRQILCRPTPSSPGFADWRMWPWEAGSGVESIYWVHWYPIFKPYSHRCFHGSQLESSAVSEMGDNQSARNLIGCFSGSSINDNDICKNHDPKIPGYGSTGYLWTT